MTKRSPLVNPKPEWPPRFDASKITVSSITANKLHVTPSPPVRVVINQDGHAEIVRDDDDPIDPPEDLGDITKIPSRTKRIRNPFRKKKS